MGTAPEQIAGRIRAAFSFWGIPERFLEHDTAPRDLIAILEYAFPKMSKVPYRLFPTSFDGGDPDLRAFPRPLRWRWASCERALRFYGARTVMTRVPHFWQLESPTHLICRNVGVPFFTNEIENIPLGASALLQAEVNTVITGASDVAEFTTYLSEHGIPFPNIWVLVHDAAAEWRVPGSILQDTLHVAQEVHLFPGVPILDQCTHLIDQRSRLFHLSDAYLWDIGTDKTRITSLGDDPIPLHRYVLPCVLRSGAQCACGKSCVQKV